MNTDIDAWMYAERPHELMRDVEESFIYFEQLLSRFRPSSELSRLNQGRGTVFVASPDLFAAVQAAIWAAQQTHGVYDPSILSLLEAAGYDRTFAAIPDPLPLSRADTVDRGQVAGGGSNTGRSARRASPARYDYRFVRFDPFTSTIWRPEGLRLDLGGMGKGWTVDRIVDVLAPQSDFMINAGGDIYCGNAPHRQRGWEIHVAHPLDASSSFATLSLRHRAIATSTIARRRWRHQGRVQHHLIDPRTGHPAQTNVISATVIAGRVFTAEVYAKAALILGARKGLALLESLPEVEGALMGARGDVMMTTGMNTYLDRLDPAGYHTP
jgi:thiamine biosynthesis lipoprotein